MFDDRLIRQTRRVGEVIRFRHAGMGLREAIEEADRVVAKEFPHLVVPIQGGPVGGLYWTGDAFLPLEGVKALGNYQVSGTPITFEEGKGWVVETHYDEFGELQVQVRYLGSTSGEHQLLSHPVSHRHWLGYGSYEGFDLVCEGPQEVCTQVGRALLLAYDQGMDRGRRALRTRVMDMVKEWVEGGT